MRIALLACIVGLAGCDTLGVDPLPDGADLQSPWTEMLDAVNAARAEPQVCGGEFHRAVGPLAWSERLEAAAVRHSRDMHDHEHFAHIGTDGSDVADRVTDAGYRWRLVGENIAVGHPSVDDVVQAWLDSPSHCRQLMDARVLEIGAAEDGRYWTQVFGTPG